jgi:hypothetical protein
MAFFTTISSPPKTWRQRPSNILVIAGVRLTSGRARAIGSATGRPEPSGHLPT